MALMLRIIREIILGFKCCSSLIDELWEGKSAMKVNREILTA
jgi:hypothetical protein